MQTETETKITYGLRDPVTGRFAWLEIDDNRSAGRDMCGDETVALTLDRWSGHMPRFEVDTVADLAGVLRDDPEWYNSSRTRPRWGDVEPAAMDAVRYTTSLTYDIRGGEPIATSTACEKIVLPPRFAGKVHPTRDKAIPSIMRKAFGDSWAAFESGGLQASIFVADISEHAISEGMLAWDPRANTCQVDKIVEIPESWPDSEYGSLDMGDPRYRLVLARCGDFVLSGAPEPIDEEAPEAPTFGG